MLSCKPNIYVSWSTSELRVRLARRETGLSPPVKYFYWQFQGSASFVDHLCYLCLVFVMLLHLFAALWSPEGKGLTSWLLFVMFNCVFVTFPFGILGQVSYLIVSIPDPCCLTYFDLINFPNICSHCPLKSISDPCNSWGKLWYNQGPVPLLGRGMGVSSWVF